MGLASLALSLACVVGPGPAERPFLMGFTRWPSDLTLEAYLESQKFAHEHGDIVSVMFIGGIPWQEALDGAKFSKDVEQNLAYRPPDGTKVFLSISPLNEDRSGLAPYWGEKDNMPLPPEWKDRKLNSPEVEKAFLAFASRAVEAMKPAYLAIGIESNVLLSKSPVKWEELKELHRETYDALKAKHPALPVCFTTELLHYKKLASEARDRDQEGQVRELMRHSDLFAMSLYPHMSYDVPRPLPADFLNFAPGIGKPLAMAESGMTSRDVELKAFGLTLFGTEGDQAAFTRRVLEAAERDRYAFVITFAGTDFEKLCAKLPAPADDLARIWAFTGLRASDGREKPAMGVWEEFRAWKYVPAR